MGLCESRPALIYRASSWTGAKATQRKAEETVLLTVTEVKLWESLESPKNRKNEPIIMLPSQVSHILIHLR